MTNMNPFLATMINFLAMERDLLFFIQQFLIPQRNHTKPHIDIVLQDENSKEILWKDKTKAFNWQQGSRLQWIKTNKFMFNYYDEETKNYCSKVISTTDYKSRDYKYPVQDSFKDKYFLSINYKRLAVIKPDYGYHCHSKLSYDQLPSNERDGIWKINFETGKGSLFFPCQICNFCTEEQFQKSLHYVNHIQIGPNGNTFVFLHRYIFEGNQIDRLILFDNEAGTMKLIASSDLISHFYWQASNALVVYLKDPSKGHCYIHINLETLQREYLSALDDYGDGHPGGFGKVMLTDTYPNRLGHQSLLILNNLFDNKKPKELAKLYHPLKFIGESRCDLHPRIDVNKKIIYFDSVYKGKRQLYRMDLSDD